MDTKYLGGYHGYSIWKGNKNMKRIHPNRLYLLNQICSKVPKKWPGWVTYVACLSHLLIIINSSVNFFIYFIKYQQRKSSARGSSLEMESMVRWAAAATHPGLLELSTGLREVSQWPLLGNNNSRRFQKGDGPPVKLREGSLTTPSSSHTPVSVL